MRVHRQALRHPDNATTEIEIDGPCIAPPDAVKITKSCPARIPANWPCACTCPNTPRRTSSKRSSPRLEHAPRRALLTRALGTQRRQTQRRRLRLPRGNRAAERLTASAGVASPVFVTTRPISNHPARSGSPRPGRTPPTPRFSRTTCPVPSNTPVMCSRGLIRITRIAPIRRVASACDLVCLGVITRRWSGVRCLELRTAAHSGCETRLANPGTHLGNANDTDGDGGTYGGFRVGHGPPEIGGSPVTYRAHARMPRTTG